MKCPSCRYTFNYTQYDVTEDEDGNPVNQYGEFYELPIKLTRSTSIYHKEDNKDLCGCPNCGNVFMNIWVK